MERNIYDNYLFRLSVYRRNILKILHYGRVIPFNWCTKGFRCFYCAKPMKDCLALKEHTMEHKDKDIDMIIRKILSKDVPVKIDVENIGCKVCGIDMSTLEDLVDHIESYHQENYDRSVGVCVFPYILNKNIMNCLLCENKYDNFMSMTTHMHKEHMKHHFVCQTCGVSFIDQVKMKRHLRHHVGYKCAVCEKVFDASHKLQRHKERVHGQMKIHECTLCSDTFENNYQLKVHMGKVHNVEKYRIKCELCPKITTTKGAMVIHMKAIHSDVKYECEYCYYKTGIKWLIKLHQRKHFGEKNYSCSVCHRKFGRSSNVRAHMKVHTGSFGRVCRECRQGFPDLEILRKHKMEMHSYEQHT